MTLPGEVLARIVPLVNGTCPGGIGRLKGEPYTHSEGTEFDVVALQDVRWAHQSLGPDFACVLAQRILRAVPGMVMVRIGL